MLPVDIMVLKNIDWCIPSQSPASRCPHASHGILDEHIVRTHELHGSVYVPQVLGDPQSPDVIADCLLIAVPLISLWNVKMPPHLRRIVLWIFTASIITALTSVLYAAFLFYTRPMYELRIYVAIMSHLESAISLVVCNLLVLVTSFYRRYRNGQDIESHYPSAATSQLPSQDTLPGLPHRHPQPQRGFGRNTRRSFAQTLTASVHFTELLEGELEGDSSAYITQSGSGGDSGMRSSTAGDHDADDESSRPQHQHRLSVDYRHRRRSLDEETDSDKARSIEIDLDVDMGTTDIALKSLSSNS
ncbi:hypothetical protein ONZ45_g6909 [Pleurotus djamor]|nr:hypothetical protein ONZ45_g6909 [Pleurotus djamor]